MNEDASDQTLQGGSGLTEEEWNLLKIYQAASEQGNAAELEAASSRLNILLAQKAPREPDTFFLLNREAHRHENAGNWTAAEQTYRDVLEYAIVTNSLSYTYWTHSALSELYSFLGQKERALEAAQEAVKVARRTNSSPSLSSMLEKLARCWLLMERADKAFYLVNEAVNLYSSDKMHDIQRARAFTFRARCSLDLHCISDARQDMECAWPLMSRLAEARSMAGIQMGLADWWKTTAALKCMEGDFAGAAAAWQAAVEHSRIVALAPQLEGPYKYAALAASLRGLGTALLAVEEVEGAEEAFRESRLLKQAIQPP